MNKQLQERDHKAIDLKEIQKVTENGLREKIAGAETQIGELKGVIRQNEKELKTVKEEISVKKSEASNNKTQIATLQQEITHVKEMLESMRIEYHGQEALIIKLKESENELQRENVELKRSKESQRQAI